MSEEEYNQGWRRGRNNGWFNIYDKELGTSKGMPKAQFKKALKNANKKNIEAIKKEWEAKDKERISNIAKEAVGTEEESTETFEDWFNGWSDETFDDYVKKFPNAEPLRNATPEEIRDNAYQFYEKFGQTDSADREYAFNFASEALNMDYDDLYYSWLDEEPISAPKEKTFKERAQQYSEAERELYEQPELSESQARDNIKYKLQKGDFESADRDIEEYGLEDEREEFIEGLNNRAASDYKKFLKDKQYTDAARDQIMAGYDDFDEAVWEFAEENDLTRMQAEDYFENAAKKLEISEERLHGTTTDDADYQKALDDLREYSGIEADQAEEANAPIDEIRGRTQQLKKEFESQETDDWKETERKIESRDSIQDARKQKAIDSLKEAFPNLSDEQINDYYDRISAMAMGQTNEKTTNNSIQDKYGLKDKRNEFTVKQFEEGSIDEEELTKSLELGNERPETIKGIIDKNKANTNNDFERWKEENSDKIASYYTETYSKDLKNINEDVWNSIAKDIYDEEKLPEKINRQAKDDWLKKEIGNDANKLQKYAQKEGILPSELQDRLGIKDSDLGLKDEYTENFEREMQGMERYLKAEEARRKLDEGGLSGYLQNKAAEPKEQLSKEQQQKITEADNATRGTFTKDPEKKAQIEKNREERVEAATKKTDKKTSANVGKEQALEYLREHPDEVGEIKDGYDYMVADRMAKSLNIGKTKAKNIINTITKEDIKGINNPQTARDIMNKTLREGTKKRKSSSKGTATIGSTGSVKDPLRELVNKKRKTKTNKEKFDELNKKKK